MADWKRRTGCMGGYFEHATANGKSLMIRHTPNGRWTVTVGGVKQRGSHQTAEAARAAAVRAAG